MLCFERSDSFARILVRKLGGSFQLTSKPSFVVIVRYRTPRRIKGELALTKSRLPQQTGNSWIQARRFTEPLPDVVPPPATDCESGRAFQRIFVVRIKIQLRATNIAKCLPPSSLMACSEYAGIAHPEQ